MQIQIVLILNDFIISNAINSIIGSAQAFGLLVGSIGLVGQLVLNHRQNSIIIIIYKIQFHFNECAMTKRIVESTKMIETNDREANFGA